MANLKDVIYLSNEDYQTLVSTGTVTIGTNPPLIYDENNLYLTPETQNVKSVNNIFPDDNGNVSVAIGGGTVTSVGAGTGLSISGTATVNPTVNIADGYKLPTTSEWTQAITDNNQTLKSNGTTFGATDAINLLNGGNITFTANTTDKTITVGVASGYSIPSTSDQTSWTNKYSKPSDGIPSTDLAESYVTTTSVNYIKSASSNGNTLTLTKGNDGTVTFTPTFTEQHVGDVVSVTATSGSGIAIGGTTANPTVGVASGYSIPSTSSQTAWSAKYDKPSDGIPDSDLKSTFVKKVNNTSPDSSGNVNVKIEIVDLTTLANS